MLYVSSKYYTSMKNRISEILRKYLVLLHLIAGAHLAYGDEGYACDHEIYCKGRLLDLVQRARIFHDSKTFVDMRMKNGTDEIMSAFELFCRNTSCESEEVDVTALQRFVLNYFSGPGDETEPWIPADWTMDVAWFGSIKDRSLRGWATDLNELWKTLGRKIKPTDLNHPDRQSLLIVPNPFIIAGDRFKEFYYWDNYWVVKGLLQCGMTKTVKGSIENLLHLCKRFGFVPNGGRVYYTKRSQPPFLSPMVEAYYEATNDLDFIRQNIETLDAEHSFWIANRTVTVNPPDKPGTSYQLARFNASSWQPRPEGYLEDFEMTKGLPEGERSRVLSNVASACESGWDFSSRWFRGSTLQTIDTRNVLPVDLNTFLVWNEKILARFYSLLGNREKETEYKMAAEARQEAMHALMWNDTEGAWFDYDLNNNSQRVKFYASNIFPLYAGAYGPKQNASETVQKVLNYLKKKGILRYSGGIPTSLINSAEQWDFPNAWPPLAHFTVESLRRAGTQESLAAAFQLAQNWLTTTYLAWEHYGHMYEKYDARGMGQPGGGGEYPTQVGFGWTNGAVLDLLHTYADKMTLKYVRYSVDETAQARMTPGEIAFAVVGSILFVLLVIGAIFIVKLRSSNKKNQQPSSQRTREGHEERRPVTGDDDV